MDSKTWDRVQQIERAYHDRKDPSKILPINLEYWRRILGAVPATEVTLGPETRMLDVGCGGAGILLALDQGVRTGVDPLMGFYIEKFPFLAEQPIKWVEGHAEDFTDQRFDVIFSINMLDHTYDPKASAQNLERLLAPGGKLVLVLNVHLTRFWRLYYETFFRFVDPPHPYHFHHDDVAAFFPALELGYQRDIDDLWYDLKDVYYGEVCSHPVKDRGQFLRNLLNPFKYPIAFSKLVLGRPFHRSHAGETPIMASTLFVFTKPQKLAKPDAI